jgi:hypothetical protein
MADLTWLTQEAHKIHDWFSALFYGLVLAFLLLGVLLEYFKWPLGGVPSFGPLVGRALVAAILLHAYPEIANLISDLTTAASQHLGDLNQFKVVLAKANEKGNELTLSWTSMKTSIVVAITYLCFFLLYFSVHVAQAFYLYAIVLLYVFSPILCALFVLPQTASATSALFRSLIEVSCWKPVWCVIATLLWSSGVSDMTASGSEISFLSTICFCLIAAGSLLMTPMVVHALAAGGISSMAQNLGSIALPGMGTVTAARTMTTGMKLAGRSYNAGLSASSRVTQRYPAIDKVHQKLPRVQFRRNIPMLVAQEKRKPMNPASEFLAKKPGSKKEKT